MENASRARPIQKTVFRRRRMLVEVGEFLRPDQLSPTSILTYPFENLEGFPEDWKTNPPSFIRYVRDHHCPSFLEYGEYPYVTADEIKKALRLKKAFSEALDQMQ